MRRLLIVVGVLIVLLLVLRNVRSSEGFQGSGTKVKGELVIAKAEWCGHCKSAMPEFKKLLKASPIRLPDGSTVTVRMLDEKTDRGEVTQLGVKGFPSILYTPTGSSAIDYNGSRTYDGVMSFLQNV
uniref:Thioredoxin domain-containing protein n=1 Tax=viral metagenome TaxID=1070528 RepID=A0A6C0AQS2_9ZZZZ